MDFIVLAAAAGLAFVLCSRWFWKLAGFAAAIAIGIMLINAHTRLVAYALDLAVPVAAVACMVKTAVWVKRRKRRRESASGPGGFVRVF